MPATPNLGLPYIDAGQAQKHVTHNEALRALDALVQLAVQDRDLAAPPDSPSEGERWIVKPGATGAWSGHANEIAAWQDGAWAFSVPGPGWVAYVIDEEILAAWDGASWSAVSAGEGGGGGDTPTELQNLTLLGVGATADAVNPLSAKLNNVLWAAKAVAEGGDGTLRYKMSKESAAKVLSILFQDNFSGRAEIGLTGDDDFHFKVSPDGSIWLEALRIDHATGRVSFPSGGVREVLAANRTYFVRTDGSDSNDGLANTSGGAFATIGKAIATIRSLDLNGFTVTIQLGDGTYTSGANFNGPVVGGNVIINGNAATPANVVISVTSANGVINSTPGFNVTIQNLELRTTTVGWGLLADTGGKITIGEGVRFGACASGHIGAQRNGIIVGTQNYSIVGASTYHYDSSLGGRIFISGGRTISMSGTLAFAAFARATSGGGITAGASIFSGGTITGLPYSATLNGVIDTSGGGASYFPGDTAGTTATGGQYN